MPLAALHLLQSNGDNFILLTQNVTVKGHQTYTIKYGTVPSAISK